MADRTILNPNNPHTGTIEVSLKEKDRAELHQLVQKHVLGRDRRVLRVLAYLDILREAPSRLSPLGQRMANAHPHLSCAAAQFQDRRSSGSGMQAAHYLPGQIMVGGVYPWELIAQEFGAAREQLQEAFAETDDLPVAFNRADSQAESGKTVITKTVQYRNSNARSTIQVFVPEVVNQSEEHQARLTEIFRSCCEAVYNDRLERSVGKAYDQWLEASGAAFRQAVGMKADKFIEAHDSGDFEAKARRALEGVLLGIAGSLGPRRAGTAAEVPAIQQQVQSKLWPSGEQAATAG